MNHDEAPPFPTLAFIGGGNMAAALIGGLRRRGCPAASIRVVEPFAGARGKLAADHAVMAVADAAALDAAGVDTVVWAVKPQTFADAAAPLAGRLGGALHLSVMAGIRSASIARAAGAARIVRAMPNTPALIGRGISGLWATPGVGAADRALVERLLAPTGRSVWLGAEADLDAVTAISGSGPAYVFYVVEAIVEAGRAMGLSADVAKALALATFDGATALAEQSGESPEALRAKVTSKGGTTHAAIESMQADGVGAAIARAVRAAQARASELGDEFGR